MLEVRIASLGLPAIPRHMTSGHVLCQVATRLDASRLTDQRLSISVLSDNVMFPPLYRSALNPISGRFPYLLKRELKLPATTFTMVSPTGLKRSANHLSVSAIESKKPKSNGSITSFFGAPKAKPADSKLSTLSTSFNKEKWVSSLTPEQKELLQLEINTLDESWLAQLKDEVVTPEFLSLKRFLKKEKQSGAKVFPPENEIYSW